MATQLFKDTMIQLAKDYRDFRKEVLNPLDKGEGAQIECTFNDYVKSYTGYTLIQSNTLYESHDDVDETIEDSPEE